MDSIVNIIRYASFDNLYMIRFFSILFRPHNFELSRSCP